MQNIFTLLLVCFGLGLVACQKDDSDGGEPDPVVGNWRSSESLDDAGNFFNSLELDKKLEGEATIYYFYIDDFYYDDFEVVGESNGNGSYEFDMDSLLGGSPNDFTMNCDMMASGEKMTCTGSGLWDDYAFEWVKD